MFYFLKFQRCNQKHLGYGGAPTGKQEGILFSSVIYLVVLSLQHGKSTAFLSGFSAGEIHG